MNNVLDKSLQPIQARASRATYIEVGAQHHGVACKRPRPREFHILRGGRSRAAFSKLGLDISFGGIKGLYGLINFENSKVKQSYMVCKYGTSQSPEALEGDSI